MLLSLLIAIGVHEAGHLLVARRVGVRLNRLRPTATGLRLMPSCSCFPSYRAECAVALGGPLFNLLSAPLFFVLFPKTSPLGELAPLSLYLCFLNLLPIRSFDGGRALVCFLCDSRASLPDRAERILSAVSAVVLLLLWAVAVYLLLRRGSALSLYLFCLQLGRCVLEETVENAPREY
ncbi:MAG: hypothetical protein J6R04_07305 [Clostridia bacterium]|nr:hypothetical protein [Clostridia bacterium]